MRRLFRSFSCFVVICLVWAASGCSSGSNQEDKYASLAISDEKSEDGAASRAISDEKSESKSASRGISDEKSEEKSTSRGISDNNSESKSASHTIAPSDTESIALDALLQMVHESYVRDNLDRAIELATCGNLRAKAEGNRTMEALFDFYYGVCQTWLGQEREGVTRMHDAVAAISVGRDSSSVCRLPFCYKELASAHIAVEELDSAIADCLAREDAIRAAQQVGAPDSIIDAWRGSNAIMLATLYDFTQRPQEGQQWLRRFRETAYASSIEGAHGMLDYLNSTDQAREYIETFSRSASYFGADTFNLRYRGEIMYLINAYHELGDMDGMCDGIARVVALNDSVMNRTLRSNSLRLQEEYKVRIARMEVAQAKKRSRRNWMLVAAVGMLMAAVIALLLRNNIQTTRKNKVLARQMNRLGEMERKLERRQPVRSQRSDAVSDEELEEQIDEWLESGDRYTSKVTVQEAAAALQITQKRIGEMLENVGKFRNLEEWATHKRVSRACRLILDHPEFTIESIATDAGFGSPRTFYRKFQAETGLSPTEYRNVVMREKKMKPAQD